MALAMEVYNKNLELQGPLDIFDSVLWREEAYDAGTFQFRTVVNEATTSLLQKDYIIRFEGETAGVIENIAQETESGGTVYMTVSGHMLISLFNRRILWGTYRLSGTPTDIMRYLVTECCIAPTRGTVAKRIIAAVQLESPAPTGGTLIRKQNTGSTLLEALTTIGEANGVAFGLKLDPVNLRYVFWARYGVDRTVSQVAVEPAFLSTELDDVLSSDYSLDSSDFKNVAYIGGQIPEDEGKRVYTTVEGSESGIDRRELFVDARDLAPEEGSADSSLDGNSTNAISNAAVTDALATKQDTLSFDDEPTAGSDNPVKSKGIKSAIDAVKVTVDSGLNSASVNPVQNKVITAQLNTKATTTYVDAQLATKQDALQWDTEPTENSTKSVNSGGIYAAIAAAGVQIDDELSSTSTHPVQNKVINTALGTKLNKADVDSALSSSSTNPVQNRVINTALGTKLNKTDVDSALSSSSTNPVQNRVINTALGTKATTTYVDAQLATKQDALQWDTEPTENSTKSVNSGGIYAAIAAAGVQIDDELSSSSTHPVQNRVINTELGKKLNKTDVDSALSSSSTNPVQNKAIHTELSKKATTTALTNLETSLTTAINAKASTADLNSAVATLNGAIALKADSADLANLADTVSALGSTVDLKANTSYVNSQLALKLNTADVDSSLSTSSTNPVQNRAITTELNLKAYTEVVNQALAGKQATLLLDNEPTQNSSNFVTSGAVWTADQGVIETTRGYLATVSGMTELILSIKALVEAREEAASESATAAEASATAAETSATDAAASATDAEASANTTQGHLNTIVSLMETVTSLLNKITDDLATSPISDSEQAITSGGTYTALLGKVTKNSSIASDTESTVVNSVASGNYNPVTSNAVYSKVLGYVKKSSSLASSTESQVADTIASGNYNPVTSNAVYSKVLGYVKKNSSLASSTESQVTDVLTIGDYNPVTSNAVKTAIDNIPASSGGWAIGDVRATFQTLDNTWLACDGSYISESDYPTLVALLQAAYGGSGSGLEESYVFSALSSYTLKTAFYAYNKLWVYLANGTTAAYLYGFSLSSRSYEIIDVSGAIYEVTSGTYVAPTTVIYSHGYLIFLISYRRSVSSSYYYYYYCNYASFDGLSVTFSTYHGIHSILESSCIATINSFGYNGTSIVALLYYYSNSGTKIKTATSLFPPASGTWAFSDISTGSSRTTSTYFHDFKVEPATAGYYVDTALFSYAESASYPGRYVSFDYATDGNTIVYGYLYAATESDSITTTFSGTIYYEKDGTKKTRNLPRPAAQQSTVRYAVGSIRTCYCDGYWLITMSSTTAAFWKTNNKLIPYMGVYVIDDIDNCTNVKANYIKFVSAEDFPYVSLDGTELTYVRYGPREAVYADGIITFTGYVVVTADGETEITTYFTYMISLEDFLGSASGAKLPKVTGTIPYYIKALSSSS